MEDTKETISQLISDYINYLEIEKGLSKNTIIAYSSDISDFFDFLDNEYKNNIVIGEIKRRDFSSYTKFLAKKDINPSSITRKIASIKGFFRFLCFRRDIKKNPSISVSSPKLPKRLPRVLTKNEKKTSQSFN